MNACAYTQPCDLCLVSDQFHDTLETTYRAFKKQKVCVRESLCVCMHIYHIYVCVCVCVCIYVYMYTCLYVCMHVKCVCMYVCSIEANKITQ